MLGEPAAVAGGGGGGVSGGGSSDDLKTKPRSKPTPAAVRRLAADPNATHATLLSPETSRVVRGSSGYVVNGEAPPSPTKARGGIAAAASAPSTATSTTTTTNKNNSSGRSILDEACAHLIRVDPRMKPLIDAHHCRVFSPEGLADRIDPFESLCSGIISQQVSGAAAKAIKKRFVDLFLPPESSPDAAAAAAEEEEDDDDNGNAATDTDSAHATRPPRRRRFPQPSQVASCPADRLRSAGLSQRKAEYLAGLAGHFARGELGASLLASLPQEELMARLTAVRGLGRWSAEMFACFALKRLDVFSLGDLGVQRGMAAFAGRDVAKLKSSSKGAAKDRKWKYMSEADMTEMSDRFRPYRSVFMWYMWRVEETDVSTME